MEIYGISNYCGKRFMLLSTAIRGNLFHPNCRHTMSLWIEGVSEKPKPLDENKIKEQARLEQKQRAMERNIRRHKRLVAGSSDPENIKRHKANLKKAQQELNAFVKEHHDILRRDYSREKVHDEKYLANERNKNILKENKKETAVSDVHPYEN